MSPTASFLPMYICVQLLVLAFTASKRKAGCRQRLVHLKLAARSYLCQVRAALRTNHAQEAENLFNRMNTWSRTGDR
jgi:hypothetical protein